jgi:hypothetical protein
MSDFLRIERVLKYIIIIIIYIIIFAKWNDDSLELILLFVFVVLNCSTFVLLFTDIASSPKNDKYATLYLLISMATIMLTNIMLFLILLDINKTFNATTFIPIKLQETNKQLLSIYKKLSIATTVLIFVYCFLFFTIYKDMNGGYTPFFYNENLIQYNDELCNIIKIQNYTALIMYIFKVLLTVSLLGCSAYMMYIINSLRLSNVYQTLINIDKPSSTISSTGVSPITVTISPPTLYDSANINNNNIYNNINNIYQNLNLNYLINGITETQNPY